ncbi:MAG: 3-hydroxybutyryl-CoA dehydrogenase [Vampirovibrio sp.]|nr:3-hydroxybutyryl-CoA dehydrogenase [Vampirovibrio sp.]
MTQTIQTVGIIGAGTMGAGIAQIIAQRGTSVFLYDIDDALLSKAVNRIETFMDAGKQKGKVTDAEIDAVKQHLNVTTDLKQAAQVDLIIEAAPENLDLKKDLFHRLDGLAPANTLLTSNTSSVSITALAGATNRPGKVAGLHFFNPAPLMPLVEVVQSIPTTDETVESLKTFAKGLDKTPVVVKDTPGFIVNRIARPFYGEALRLLGGNAASVETIDTIVKEAGGFKMGPFELIDLIGVDVNLAVSESVYEATYHEPRYRPHPHQRRMVEAGHLGKKSGKGFYDYE